MRETNSVYKVLCLDGGGSKGMYTLGVLREVERLLGKPLNKEFQLFYGTSTGSIIASALALGHSVDEIIDFYNIKVASIMKTFRRSKRSAALQLALEEFFGATDFSSVPVGLGVVATNKTDNQAMVFKSLLGQAHGMKHTFKPGFGRTIAEAVQSSCSAYPFFDSKKIFVDEHISKDVIDGGFVANNPALYALVDVRESLKIPSENVRFLTIGTGVYPEKYPVYAATQGIFLKPNLKLISMQFTSNANSVETVFRLLSKDIMSVRINETFAQPKLGTSLFESDLAKLQLLLAKGKESFVKFEGQITNLLV